jgi:hypothetical protein
MPTDGRNPCETSVTATVDASRCSVEEICSRFLPFRMFISSIAVWQAHVCHYQLRSCDVMGFFFYCFELKMSTSNSVCHCWYICVCTVDSSVMIITLIHLLLNAAVEKSVGCSATSSKSRVPISARLLVSPVVFLCFVSPRRQMSGQYVISGHIRYLHILPFDTIQGDSRLNVLM